MREDLETFSYPFYVRHKGAIYALLALVSAMAFSAYAILFGEGNVKLALGILAILVFLVSLLSIWAEMRSRIVYSDVELSDIGLKAQLRKAGIEYFPKENRSLIPWEEFDRVEEFHYPDFDSAEAGGVNGLRLWKKDSRILIYQNISDYSKIYSRIKSYV